MFTFDAAKDAANVSKHGVSLASFATMTDVLFRADVAHSTTEVRYHAFGRIDGEVFAAVVTFRGSDVRVISLRRASRRERRMYGEATA